MTKTAVITGAGSGVGRATALLLAEREWRVALIGRREDTLKETMSLAGKSASRMLVYPCDISNPELVTAMAKAVTKAFGEIEVLVNAAGTNTPARSLRELSFELRFELGRLERSAGDLVEPPRVDEEVGADQLQEVAEVVLGNDDAVVGPEDLFEV